MSKITIEMSKLTLWLTVGAILAIALVFDNIIIPRMIQDAIKIEVQR